jgi:hypothetical protein
MTTRRRVSTKARLALFAREGGKCHRSHTAENDAPNIAKAKRREAAQIRALREASHESY